MKPSLADVEQGVVSVLQEAVDDIGIDDLQVTRDSAIVGDLELSSVDVLHVLASIDMHFRIRLPYERLIMRDGEYVQDLRASEIAAFVHDNFDENFAYPKKM